MTRIPFPIATRRRARRRIAMIGLLGLTLSPATEIIAQPFADYNVLDRVEGANVMLNAAPIRPMVFHDATGFLFTVNTNASTLDVFAATSLNPVFSMGVPWGPVSIAIWDGGPNPETDDDQILVVCRNTWCMARIDFSGNFVGLTRLPGEPSDILVDQANDRAFITSMAEDTVVEIDLTQNPIAATRIYNEQTEPGFQIKSPVYLSFDEDGNVLVAPLHSGNNSVAIGGAATGGLPTSLDAGNIVIDLADPSVALQGLPDNDLFRIDPSQPAGSAVSAVASAMGTILFAHGIHPITHELWQLNTEANNKGPAQSEPAVKGHFVFNRITKISTPFGSPSTPSPANILSLDPPAMAANQVMGQPTSLAFHPNGDVFVCAMLTDNVAQFDSSGNLIREWNLPDGSIPRAILLDPSGTFTLTYCFGTNEVVVNFWNQPDPALGAVAFQLTPDPTPANIQEGRRIFYDADHSEDKNVSCASCHIDGGTDFLAWNLSNDPKDDKGPMVTQTLVGLERLEPFHWRGERSLEDFNGAFVGLLGASAELPLNEFQQLKDFLFALKNPANPFQHPRRRLDASAQFISTLPNGTASSGGNAITGQTAWTTPTFPIAGNTTSCNSCHQLPTGTNNDVVTDAGGANPNERSHFKPTPFHEIWRKKQSLVNIQLVGRPPSIRSFLGSGTSHGGVPADIFRFVEIGNLLSNSDDQVDFMHQWDQGMGRAVHFSYLLDSASTTAAANNNLNVYLQGQINLRNCDAVVMGMTVIGGTPKPVRWFYDRFATPAAYYPEDPTLSLAPRQVTDFVAAMQPDEVQMFVGVPVGSGMRFGVDFDADGLLNGVDPQPRIFATNPSDTMAPSFIGTPAVDWVSTRVARLRFDTNEPTTATVTYTDNLTGIARQVHSDVPGTTHSMILSALRGSTAFASSQGDFATEAVTYSVRIDIADVATTPNTNMFTIANPTTTRPFFTPEVGFSPSTDEPDREIQHEHILNRLDLTLNPSGSVSGTVTLRAALKQGLMVPDPTAPVGTFMKPPAAGRLFVLRVMHSPAGSSVVTPVTTVTAGTGGLIANSVVLSLPPNQGPGPAGPFLVNRTLTPANGTATITFVMPAGLVNPNDRVFVNVEGVLEVPPNQAAAFQSTLNGFTCTGACQLVVPVNATRAWSQWDFPTTKEALACVEKTL